MSISVIIILSGLGVIVAVWIITPFFMKKSNPQHLDIMDEGEQQKEQIFNQLSDLEYDYHMNKITVKDYETAKTELMAKAAHAMGSVETDSEQIEKEVDEEIEEYIGSLFRREKEALHEG